VPAALLVGDVELRAEPSVQQGLVQALRTSGTLYDWAAGQPQARALRGRAPVYVAALAPGGEQVVIRHAWHGGLLAPLTRDRFRRPTRAPREYQLSGALRRAGVPTTAIVGFACYPAGPGFARVDVVSRYLPDAVDLAAVLAGHAPDMDIGLALEATAELLATLARHGIVHPDLNGKNILLRPIAGGSGDALVIDVDAMSWDPSRPMRLTMARNVARLTRSLRKAQRNGESSLSEAALTAFAARVLTAGDAPPTGSRR
jgi:3-deoxy-D-manno-octulosonic acid kinase